MVLSRSLSLSLLMQGGGHGHGEVRSQQQTQVATNDISETRSCCIYLFICLFVYLSRAKVKVEKCQLPSSDCSES